MPDIKQIIPGLEGDLEEWQTQEANVTRGEAKGDIELVILFVSLFQTALLVHAHNIVHV